VLKTVEYLLNWKNYIRFFHPHNPRTTSYGVTLPKYSTRFRALSQVEVSKAQVVESGRTE